MTDRKPRIAIIPGDPSGIGPELIAKLLEQEGVKDAADILLIGDQHVWQQGAQQAALTVDLAQIDEAEIETQEGLAWLPMQTIAPEDVKIAEVTVAGGASSLRCLDKALDLAMAGKVDGVLFGPFNKAALTSAGLNAEDEHRYIARHIGFEGYHSEINVLDNLMTRPHIAVAALNPHAGDNGKFGREEIDILQPVIKAAQAQQKHVTGPWPSDTVFLKAKRGEVDAVVTMYHDQGQIAIKLMGFDRGVTVAGGLPIPIATPAHGTAFDIAGQNKANVGATLQAFNLLVRMARNHRASRAAA